MKYARRILSDGSIRSAALSVCWLASVVLSGCAYPPGPGPSGQIISRLPAGAPGAATPAAQTLSPAEQARYAQIDQQVMADQAERSRVQAWAAAIAATPVYYGYSYYTPYGYPAYYSTYPVVYGPGW